MSSAIEPAGPYGGGVGVKGALSPPPPPEATELNFNLLLINDLKFDLTNCV